MKFDKERTILFLLKAVSYIVNTIIIVGIVGGVCFFVYTLFMGSTSKIKKHKRVDAHIEQVLYQA